MKINPALYGLSLALAICLGAIISQSESREKDEKIQALQIKVIGLCGYKEAFLDHIPKCDTLHKGCFKTHE